MKPFSARKRWIIYGLISLIVIAAFIWILPISLPIVFALITAFILEPTVRMFQKRFPIKRNLSVFIVFTLFVVLMGLGSYVLVTKVVTSAINFVENSPAYITEMNNVWEDIQQNFENAAQDLPEEFVSEINSQVDQFLESIRGKILEKNYVESLTSVVSLIPSYLVSILVYLITLFLFLLEFPRLHRRFYAHLTEKSAEKVHFMTTRLSYVIFGFMKAQFLLSIVIFVAALIGLYIIVPEVALLMAFIIWIIDFIPIIGSIIILGPWAIYYLLIGNIVLGTKLAVLAVILLIIRRTVEPKVMGHHIGLSALSTLIAMYLGLKILGPIGFIVGPLLIILFNSAREAGIVKTNFKI
ncbi:sporulation integral membrane protein YtvI [Pseudalkalibacillus berkeleyi]|uniref:sporulation integral membrane protein YtvI n=1 Tax=Pseudalkalibacillus berkeleyi TaxID=1069813 RepID=UPI0022A8935D|nr:sporulation integral membrane protein YtvI [Pseudalkalibacillus berkeleyi]